VPVNLPFNQAVERLEEGLKQEGFGVLCRIDIQAKLKEKLGVDFPRYIILGACNPPIAHQALQQELNLGLLLPCNAVVYERDGRTYAGVIDATKMLAIVENPSMESMAQTVNEKLRRAIDSLAASKGDKSPTERSREPSRPQDGPQLRS
jgi:uncharacterized protein (DUF302 family)